jgi:hypothetical protein
MFGVQQIWYDTLLRRKSALAHVCVLCGMPEEKVFPNGANEIEDIVKY